jgi:hypothetical protein
MSAEEVEDAVAIKSPVAGTGDLSQPLKLFGEDALLDWPGAMEPIIRDRDTFMAKALAGAATGQSAEQGLLGTRSWAQVHSSVE